MNKIQEIPVKKIGHIQQVCVSTAQSVIANVEDQPKAIIKDVADVSSHSIIFKLLTKITPFLNFKMTYKNAINFSIKLKLYLFSGLLTVKHSATFLID